MKKISGFSSHVSILSFIVLFVCSFSTYAQTITLARFACPDVVKSTFIDENYRPETSDYVCSSGTKVYHKVKAGEELTTEIKSTRLDNGPHRAQLDITWKPGVTSGKVTVEIWYTKNIWKASRLRCKSDERYLCTYEIYKGFENINPAGSFTGTFTTTAPSNVSPSTFNLFYKPASGTLLPIKKIRYNNGQDAGFIEQNVSKSPLIGYLPAPITFHTVGKGSFTLNVDALVENGTQCFKWITLAPQTLTVKSSCYMDEFSQVSITPVGPDVKMFELPKAFGVKSNQSYTLNILGITDFGSNYTLNFQDFGQDVSRSGSAFTPLKKGSYNITINANVEGCPSPDAVGIIVDGESFHIEQKCPVVLPADISLFYPELVPADLPLRHFTAYVKTERHIIINPGVTLELGAELILDVAEEDPGDIIDSDAVINFSEQTSYDEYGRVTGASRSYFDDKGTPLQTQYKDVSANVMLATATIYDAYQRAAISTLPAPVRTITPDECVNDSDAKSVQVNFKFKPDFIKSAVDHKPYDYTHFDLTKELTPEAVEATTEETLGWYYSSNNTKEPLVATTQFPYTRVLFQKDGSGEVKSGTRPGDEYKAGSPDLNLATSINSAVEAIDEAIFNASPKGYLSIRGNELHLSAPATIIGNFVKTTSMDESGNKSVVYSDKSGTPLINIYYGKSNTPITTSYNFYDDAGRQLVSISPNGLLQYTGSNFSDIDKTVYFYNGRGLLSAVEEKIAGSAANGISRTEYIYRKDGSIRFSQNAEQRKDPLNRYSYINYDNSGRSIESGEYIAGASGIVFNSLAMKSILENTMIDGGLTENNATKRERHFINYDDPQNDIPDGRVQRFVYGAVSSTSKDSKIKTWYSYDEQGRLEWMVQDITNLGIKTVDYRYGPTGQIQDVIYQIGKTKTKEQFTHHYEYDLSGRLKKVYTTPELLVYDVKGVLKNDGVSYTDQGEIDNPGQMELQATYHYYLHGPLKRIELAKKLQGIDYIYTADGALKSINHSDPASAKDPGGDGFTNDFEKDVFGMTLDYHANDYMASNGTSNSISNTTSIDQYTGLIKAMRWHSPIEPDKQFAYSYQYDERDQFKRADWGTINPLGILIQNTVLNPYLEEVTSYDKNGNINALKRNAGVNFLNSDNANITIADFSYHYKPNTNTLDNITQGSGSTLINSYTYNDLGQMTKETEGTKSKYVLYDVSGKVTEVYMDVARTKLITSFTYDDRGYRLSKTTHNTKPNKEGQLLETTWYVRDASGNVLCTYSKLEASEDPVRPIEMPIYAESRIGLYDPNDGYSSYEIADHLGNVRAVIGEKITDTYMATLEPERAQEEVVEDEFIRLESSSTAPAFNHTPTDFSVDGVPFHIDAPNRVNRLNNKPNGVPAPDPIGTGIMVWVHPGDVINMKAFAKYANFDANKKDFLPAIATFLSTSFTGAPMVDGSSMFSVVNTSGFAALPVWAGLDDNQPKAFLNYLLFDNNFKLQQDGFKFDQVSTAADISQAPDPMNHPHEELSLEVTIQKEGYIYVYVSNQSEQNMDVYFDDLTVKQTYSNIVAGGDFYPYGLGIKDRQIDRDNYRHGYQGQFAEKDLETGWNHFQLREYDPVVGRWISPDPAGQYYSPYVGMGNNPVSGIDPDGAYTKWGALWRSGFGLWGDIYQSGSDGAYGEREVWGFNAFGKSYFGSDAKSWSNDGISNRINQLAFQQYMNTLSSSQRMLMGPGDGIEYDAFTQFTMVFSAPLSIVGEAAKPSWMVASSEFNISARFSYNGATKALSELNPTHFITKSESKMKLFVRGIKADKAIYESIKYVNHNGVNYIVDGHHRFFGAQKLGMGRVLAEEVSLPFKGYRTTQDLLTNGRQPVWWGYFKP